MLEEHAAIGILPPVIAWRKVIANIAKCSRTQNCVGEGMPGSICIRMPLQRCGVRDFYAA